MTVGLCVVLLEMTNMTATLPFLMLVVIVAKGTADRWNDSIIVRRISLKRLPFLARMPHLSYRRQTVTAADVAVTSGNPVLPPCAALPFDYQLWTSPFSHLWTRPYFYLWTRPYSTWTLLPAW